MGIRVKINIVNENYLPFMGPGPLRLLERIGEFKSINKAARDMNLSYVKALSMLNRLEENAGQKLLIRKRGGNTRGGTELTPFAWEYIEKFKELETKIKEFAEKEYKEIFECSEEEGE